MAMPTLSPDDRLIAVMGVTGVGKSSFVQLFTEEPIGVGHDLESWTTEVAIFPCKIPGSNERFYLVDTPGFDDTTKSDEEVFREVAIWLARSYSEGIRLSGIIYLHQITDVRLKSPAMRNLSVFRKLCGESQLGSVVLATTFWDRVDIETGSMREEQLMSTSGFWGGMIDHGTKVFRHDTGVESGRVMIEYLLARTESRLPVYGIQNELVNEGKTLGQTAAGLELQAEMDKMCKRHEQQLEELQVDMKEAIMHCDENWRESVEQEMERHEKFLSRQREQRKMMEVDQHGLWAQRGAEREQERQQQKINLEVLQAQIAELQHQISSKVKADAEAKQELAGIREQLAIQQAGNRAWEAAFSLLPLLNAGKSFPQAPNENASPPPYRERNTRQSVDGAESCDDAVTANQTLPVGGAVSPWSFINDLWQKELGESAPLWLCDCSAADVQEVAEAPIQFGDRVKLRLEHFTAQPWDWALFKAPRRTIPVGKVRLVVRACCGRTKVFDVTPPLAQGIRHFLTFPMQTREWPKTHPSESPDTGQQLHASHNHTQSNATGTSHHGFQNLSQTSSQISPSSKSSSSSTLRSSPTTQPTLSSASGSQSNTKSTQPTTRFVLLCVRNMSGPKSLQHDQIPIPGGMTDNEFCAELRDQYRRLRGWYYWSHVDKFWYCHCSRYYKWDSDKLSWEQHEMPTDSVYTFIPNPPADPYSKPVGTDEWEHGFHENCRRKGADDLVYRIPKRDHRFEITTCVQAHLVWGLHVEYRTSARTVLAYCILILSPGIIFCIMWLLRFPTDLQNATVPITLLLTMVGFPIGLETLGGQFRAPQSA